MYFFMRNPFLDVLETIDQDFARIIQVEVKRNRLEVIGFVMQIEVLPLEIQANPCFKGFLTWGSQPELPADDRLFVN